MVGIQLNQSNGLIYIYIYKIPAVLALVHSEVSEALEAFRIDDKENFIEELADVVIRVLDLSEGLEMDIATKKPQLPLRLLISQNFTKF